jgi:hypothetical protein
MRIKVSAVSKTTNILVSITFDERWVMLLNKVKDHLFTIFSHQKVLCDILIESPNISSSLWSISKSFISHSDWYSLIMKLNLEYADNQVREETRCELFVYPSMRDEFLQDLAVLHVHIYYEIWSVNNSFLCLKSDKK